MRSIVTGGSGFVGSHLCDKLIGLGHEVLCVDNLITGRLENISHLRSHKSFKFLKHDVTRPLKNAKADFIFHLASPASPVGYMKYSIETILTNSIGTQKTLELAQKTKARFLFASTSEIYGDPKIHPQIESYWGNVNSFGPRSCYDESKRLGEALVYEYLHKFKVDARIVRIFNTYGPRLNESDGRVVSNFITQALRGRPLTIYGKGSQTRSFCYVSDLVEGLIKAASLPKTRGEVINLGNPQETTILRFARLTLDLCRYPGGKIIQKPLPQDDPIRRKPDISKAKRLLRWEPKVSLEDGLRPTIAWYRGKIKD